MRGVPRWLAVVAVLAIVTVVCAFTVIAHWRLQPLSRNSPTARFLLTALLPPN